MPRMRKPLAGFSLARMGSGGLVKLRDKVGHFFLSGAGFIARMHRGYGKAFAIGVGVGQRAFESLAAKNDDEAVFLCRL